MVEWSFDTRDPQSTRKTRLDFVNYVHRVYGGEADITVAELVLGELIGNVVRHAPGRANVQADFDEHGVTIAVQDFGSGFAPAPHNAESGLLSESGRGLTIVSALADTMEIGCPAGHAGCCVRARLGVRREH